MPGLNLEAYTRTPSPTTRVAITRGGEAVGSGIVLAEVGPLGSLFGLAALGRFGLLFVPVCRGNFRGGVARAFFSRVALLLVVATRGAGAHGQQRGRKKKEVVAPHAGRAASPNI